MVTNNSLCSFDWKCLWFFFVSSGFRILGWPFFSFISLEMLIHYLLASIVSVKSTTVILTVAFFKLIYLKFFFYSAFKIFFYTFGLQQYYYDVPRYLFLFYFNFLALIMLLGYVACSHFQFWKVLDHYLFTCFILCCLTSSSETPVAYVLHIDSHKIYQ